MCRKRTRSSGNGTKKLKRQINTYFTCIYVCVRMEEEEMNKEKTEAKTPRVFSFFDSLR